MLSAILLTFLYIFLTYIFVFKLLPYFLYPNYFRKAKTEDYSQLKILALSLKGQDRLTTAKNVYDYMTKTYSGCGKVYKFKNLATLFRVSDFNTDKILNNHQFLFCHSQNRLLKSILVNTGMFKGDDIQIKIEWLKHIYIHQFIMLNLNDSEIKVDPFYHVIEIS